jgi:hypothetical protein
VLTVHCSVIFSIHFVLAVFSIFFGPSNAEMISDEESYTNDKGKAPAHHQQWEMMRIPDTPGTTGGLKSPATPRTRAFNSLGGDGGGLPFREQFPPPPTKPIKEKGRFF